MKIGITGATGQLGHLVIEKLNGMVYAENIVALVRSPQKAAELGVESREFDYTKPDMLGLALAGIDTLLLISGSDIGQRAAQHANVIEAAKKAGVKWIVYTSLLHADTSTISLAGEHRATEKALKESGIPHTILRNGWYTENFAGSIPGAIAGGAYLGSAGDGKFSCASRADFAEAAVAVLTGKGHEGRIFELAGDIAYTLTDLAAEITKQSGKTISYKDLPEAEYAGILKGYGLPEGLAQAIASWDVSVSKGDLFDNGKQLSKLIGRSTTPLAETIRPVVRGSATNN